ncbi:hypothetical protein [Thiomicrorhabdus arctica]|jgi:hypothetical protein|uniref:hypothetical protein n=1 Tax=Thiomicrorhabdus arctica TaxID=131540 RepID=UPI000377E0A1|nr:hypothetical protein [Thiomicrorhabdus arctica]
MQGVSSDVSPKDSSVRLVITGLPGSGKSRVMQSLQHEMPRPGCFESQDLSDLNQVTLPYQILCVVDVRTPLVSGRDDWLEARLQQLLLCADGIIFSFLESAALDDQVWWNKWVALHAGHLPIVRWLNQSFPRDWQGFPVKNDLRTLTTKTCTKSLKPLSEFEFNVGRICWEHLLFGLDSSKQNLGMKIARVKGIVQTLEYENAVTVEGSATRWDLFAADEKELTEEALGRLQIQGEDLDQIWLKEIVKASLV